VTGTLALTARLRALSDGELRAAISARQVTGRGTGTGTGIHDFFDLAEALLERESVQRALARLDRQSLATLAAAAAQNGAASPREIVERLVAWGAEPDPPLDVVSAKLRGAADMLLLDRATVDSANVANAAAGGDAVRVYDAVRDVLSTWPEHGLPSGPELAASVPPSALSTRPTSAKEHTDRLASQQAFATVAGVSELIAELIAEPANELQKGGLALPSVKRLATALAVPIDDVPGIVSIAARAGLVVREGRLWLATDAGTGWQQRPTVRRWSTLVSAWLDALPVDIHALLAGRANTPWGDGLRALIAWRFPAGGEDIQRRVSIITRDAGLLGLTAGETPSSPGALLLERGIEAATSRMETLFPAEVDQVYLQHDLSVVAPGPLAPAIDARLRSMADVEGRALASAYRVSEGSVNRALASGATAEAILAFLGEISLTGIPQPLEYLIAEAAARYGRLRVGAIDDSATDAPQRDSRDRSCVTSDDLDLLHTLEVDQALAALGLVRHGTGRLVSRFGRDDVFWALSDARYPVAAVGADGAIVNLRRGRIAPAARREPGDSATPLIERLRAAEAAAGPDAARAWLARQLDIAVRARVALIVSVEMPDGRVVDYELEPTGVGGGRLRGRDRQSDIERTLPLSSITGIRPAEATGSND
jgi:hypothetical protein